LRKSKKKTRTAVKGFLDFVEEGKGEAAPEVEVITTKKGNDKVQGFLNFVEEGKDETAPKVEKIPKKKGSRPTTENVSRRGSSSSSDKDKKNTRKVEKRGGQKLMKVVQNLILTNQLLSKKEVKVNHLA